MKQTTLHNIGESHRTVEGLKNEDKFLTILPQDGNTETLPEFPVCLACSVDFRLNTATLTWMSSLSSCPWISDLPGLTIVWGQFLNIYVIYYLFIYLHTQLSTYYISVYMCNAYVFYWFCLSGECQYKNK